MKKIKENFSTKKATNIFKQNSVILFLVALIIIGSFVSETFLRRTNWQNIFIDVSVIGLLAIGQTVVMLVKEIDLSIGASLAFSPIAAIAVINAITPVLRASNYVVDGMAWIIILTIAISSLIGLINGLALIKLKVPSLITTLGLLYALRGSSFLFFGGYSLYLTRLEGFDWLGTHRIFNVPLMFIIFLAVAIVLTIVLKYTKIGHRIYATGGNEKAAILSGINTNRWKCLAFIFSGFCAGLAAIMYSSRMQSVETVQGTGYEFQAIAIAVIGGTTLAGGQGSIFNTMVASIILVVILNILSLMGLVAWYQTIVIGFIIVAAALQHSRQNKTISL